MIGAKERTQNDDQVIPKDAWAQRMLIILDLLTSYGNSRRPQSIPELKRSGRLSGVRDPDIKKLIDLMVRYEWLKPTPKKTKKRKRIPGKKDPLHYPLTTYGHQVLETITQLRKDGNPLTSLYIFDGIGQTFVD